VIRGSHADSERTSARICGALLLTPGQASTTGPSCDAEHPRNACRIHADCAQSRACSPEGFCLGPCDTAYVDAAASDTDTCSRQAPCTPCLDYFAVTFEDPDWHPLEVTYGRGKQETITLPIPRLQVP